ncbi:unnamed protein product [Caenorhabditis sp. 36 PRJEB53466]|nr:unnamed protein product [Caenorhabditis sp. 36 PRJEB53466]
MKEVSAKKPSGKGGKAKKKLALSDSGGDEKFESIDFILKHFKIQNWKDFQGLTYTAEEVLQLLEMTIECLSTEKNALVKVVPPITIVGDLNGQFRDLIRIFNVKTADGEKGKEEDELNRLPFASQRFLFLGNYTEGGRWNLETICLIFALKYFFDKRYILLRGCQETCTSTEFEGQLYKKWPSQAKEIWAQFQKAFSLMPVAATVGDKILCVHSGISPEMRDSLAEMQTMKTGEETVTPLVRDLVNACPVEEDGVGAEADEPVYLISVNRDYTKTFNEAAVKVFCEKTKIQLIVRSHEVPLNGFRFFADRRLITIFSASMYNNYNNKSAFLNVDATGKVAIVQLQTCAPNVEKPEQKVKKSAEKVVDKSEEKKKKKTTHKSAEKVVEKTPVVKKATSKPSKELESIFDNISG